MLIGFVVGAATVTGIFALSFLIFFLVTEDQ